MKFLNAYASIHHSSNNQLENSSPIDEQHSIVKVTIYRSRLDDNREQPQRTNVLINPPITINNSIFRKVGPEKTPKYILAARRTHKRRALLRPRIDRIRQRNVDNLVEIARRRWMEGEGRWVGSDLRGTTAIPSFSARAPATIPGCLGPAAECCEFHSVPAAGFGDLPPRHEADPINTSNCPASNPSRCESSLLSLIN